LEKSREELRREPRDERTIGRFRESVKALNRAIRTHHLNSPAPGPGVHPVDVEEEIRAARNAVTTK
jgi:hypothetical protein